ncbi:PREDICTED: protein PAM68, chloroplastic-like [Camelina sativa]|uniref:Protein PAM68, chloroplastic-like n=1 Tax=Camelina sativa TaxID=90675 RepID=A0ABM0V1G4_CAMSA|nr:PREDICTED: protein PAM68, chloroplastic-like [Camelina sativa]
MASVPCSFKLSAHPRSSSKRDGNYKQCSLVERPKETKSQVPKSITCINRLEISRIAPLQATMNSPRGFGRPPKKTKKAKKQKPGNQSDDEDDDDDEEDEDDDDDYDYEDERERGVIPEIVTNRMISRMGFTVGLPLFVGLLFFPFFYYLKVGLKIDVPTWVPFIVSFVFFGTALAGVSYGIVSSSWDPLREGSLLGWNEAKKNWPVFWQSFWNSSSKK